MVKAKYAARTVSRDPRDELQNERARIEKTIERLRTRLKEIDKRIQAMGKDRRAEARNQQGS